MTQVRPDHTKTNTKSAAAQDALLACKIFLLPNVLLSATVT